MNGRLIIESRRLLTATFFVTKSSTFLITRCFVLVPFHTLDDSKVGDTHAPCLLVLTNELIQSEILLDDLLETFFGS